MLTDLNGKHSDDSPNHSPVCLEGKLSALSSPGGTYVTGQNQDVTVQDQEPGFQVL